jgi:hypothetical protein
MVKLLKIVGIYKLGIKLKFISGNSKDVVFFSLNKKDKQVAREPAATNHLF